MSISTSTSPSKQSAGRKPKRRKAHSNGPASFCKIPQDHLQELARCEALPARTRVLMAFELLLYQFGEQQGARRVSLADLQQVTGLWADRGAVAEARARLLKDGLIALDQASGRWMFTPSSGPRKVDQNPPVTFAPVIASSGREISDPQVVGKLPTSSSPQVVGKIPTTNGREISDHLRACIRTSQEKNESRTRQEVAVAALPENTPNMAVSQNGDIDSKQLQGPKRELQEPGWLLADEPAPFVVADPVLLASWRQRHPAESTERFQRGTWPEPIPAAQSSVSVKRLDAP
ncbi:hypothetical protein EPN29_01930 [bacterium]|nr:MAG: hypothetical protein EPN29_01930 [bacterium]